MHIAWHPGRFIESLNDRFVKSNLRTLSNPPGNRYGPDSTESPFEDFSQGKLNHVWVSALHLAGIYTHREVPVEKRLGILRQGMTAELALFRAIASDEPTSACIWGSEPTIIAPLEPFSLATVHQWNQLTGLVAFLGDQKAADTLADIGSSGPGSAAGFTHWPYCVPLAECWVRFVANRDWNSYHAEAIAAANQWIDEPDAKRPTSRSRRRTFERKDGPLLRAIEALDNRDAGSFDHACLDFFKGHKKRYVKKTFIEGEGILSPIGLGLLAMARRAGVPCSITSDFAPAELVDAVIA